MNYPKPETLSAAAIVDRPNYISVPEYTRRSRKGYILSLYSQQIEPNEISVSNAIGVGVGVMAALAAFYWVTKKLDKR